MDLYSHNVQVTGLGLSLRAGRGENKSPKGTKVLREGIMERGRAAECEKAPGNVNLIVATNIY